VVSDYKLINNKKAPHKITFLLEPLYCSQYAILCTETQLAPGPSSMSSALALLHAEVSLSRLKSALIALSRNSVRLRVHFVVLLYYVPLIENGSPSLIITPPKVSILAVRWDVRVWQHGGADNRKIELITRPDKIEHCKTISLRESHPRTSLYISLFNYLISLLTKYKSHDARSKNSQHGPKKGRLKDLRFLGQPLWLRSKRVRTFNSPCTLGGHVCVT